MAAAAARASRGLSALVRAVGQDRLVLAVALQNLPAVDAAGAASCNIPCFPSSQIMPTICLDPG